MEAKSEHRKHFSGESSQSSNNQLLYPNFLDQASEQEESAEYRKGGYHPVHIGDQYHGRYYVIRKLGFGSYSTVWLCWDQKDKHFVALKILKSASIYTNIAYEEIKILRIINGADPRDPNRYRTVRLLNDFKITGVNGQHIGLVFEVTGCNLSKLLLQSNGRGLPLANVRTIVKQVLEGLEYLHSKCKIVHGDLKPENLLICVKEDYNTKLASEVAKIYRFGIKLPASMVANAPLRRMSSLKIKRANKRRISSFKWQLKLIMDTIEDNKKAAPSVMNTSNSPSPSTSWSSDEKPELNPAFVNSEMEVKIADLGLACRIGGPLYETIQTRPYRSLEVLLGAEYDTSADIWSTACLTFELATGHDLFALECGETYPDENHLAQIIELLGDIPKKIVQSGTKSHLLFNKQNKLCHIEQLHPSSLEDKLRKKYDWSVRDAQEFAAFLLPMLQFDVNKRATASECLKHQWLKLNKSL
ncbi:unnamed protein product [Ceutorhynchus assimilis]|uniref:non-specific serine/threonine protein kinase n=1 Tax=Ceutorhynchus assimilis TaxID=467358 RepID=A0A9N9QKA1_9CUCU|nr:unnamed protein product [Ceutorhynchus assimilis]